MHVHQVITRALLVSALAYAGGCGADTPAVMAPPSPVSTPPAAGSTAPVTPPPTTAGSSGTTTVTPPPVVTPPVVMPPKAGTSPSTAGTGGMGAMATGGAGGSDSSMTAGSAGADSMAGAGGADAAAGMGGMMADAAGSTAPAGTGMCCADGDCICRGEPPADLTYKATGPYKTMSYRLGSSGTVYYPTDAEAPLASIAIIPGFLNTGPEMAPWGPFYASYGIVLVATNSGAADQPATRASHLLDAIKALKAENTKMGSPLFGKLSDRYGTSGYSMGGGGTTIASGREATLKSSIGLAAWGGSGSNVKVPTLLLCGSADTVAACSMSSSVYRGIADSTPKMQLTISGSTHFNWFGPADGERGKSGMTALAFAKVYLEGDERWKPLLLKAGGMTNIK